MIALPLSVKNEPLLKNLVTIFCMITFCGCSSSLQFISTNQPDQIKDLNREIKNAKVIIEQNNGNEITGRIVEIAANSIFYFNSESRSLPNSKVSTIRAGSKARGFYALGIAITGYGVYQLATANSASNFPEGLGKLYLGLGSIVLGGCAFSLGYYDFERTYYLN